MQDDLSISDSNIGVVLQAQGDLLGALSAFGDSLTIAQAQAQHDPTNAQWQQQLAFVLPRIAEIEIAQADVSAAVTAEKERVEVARRIHAATPSDKANAALAGALSDLSWGLLLDNHAQEALDRVTEALALAPSLLVLEENRATALLLLGRFDEARAIYLADKDKPLNGKNFADVVREDFVQLRKFGIDTPDMKRIEELLAG